jgi:F-type H+-transporting ATPase subunit a
MELRDISPDQVVYWSTELLGYEITLNATIVYTWLVMAILVVVSGLVTSRLSTGPRMSRLQNVLEVIVSFMRSTIREVSSGQSPDRYLPFIGTLFIFILVSNLMAVIPGFTPPTASLSTTAGLAIVVFFAVFGFGIARRGFVGYFKLYLKPTPIMLPFNIIGEVSRTLALAVRLFGNMMSGVKIGGILLAVAPFVFPVLMNLLGILTGAIQAYIFAILAMVYIASATRLQQKREQEQEEQPENQGAS